MTGPDEDLDARNALAISMAEDKSLEPPAEEVLPRNPFDPPLQDDDDLVRALRAS